MTEEATAVAAHMKTTYVAWGKAAAVNPRAVWGDGPLLRHWNSFRETMNSSQE